LSATVLADQSVLLSQGARAPSLAIRWEALRRRRIPALSTFVLVLAAAGTAAVVWPASYRSTGTILIEQQELPSDLVQSTITSYADQRIQVISQRVMTTENLLRIIQRYDLYPMLRKNEPREVLLKHMRDDIRFEMISADVMDPRQGRATKADIAFTVSYDSAHGDVAARVANELVSLYLDENVKSRRQKTADAATFLQGEAEKLNKAIETLQASIAQFKNQHINSLPDQANISNQTLMRAQDQLTEVDTQLRSLEQQKTYLDAQLAQISPTSQTYTSTGERVLSPADQLKYLRTQYAQLTAIYASDHPDVMRVKREIEGLEQTVSSVDSGNDLRRQLEQARTALATARQRYAPDHPDVVRLERQIATLTQAIQDATPAAQVAPAAAAAADNPAYIQIKAQREAATAEVESLETKRTELQAKIAQLEARLAASPAVERDYVTMLRELDSDQLKYREVQQKEEEAQLAQNLEDEQKGERFTLIDPPLAPESPVSPNRWLIVGVGLVAALALSIGLALLLDSRDHSVRNRQDLETLVHAAPLAVVPMIFTSEDHARFRRRRRLAMAGAVGALAIALVLTHLFYRPLDVLWDVALRKLGG
jgi:uncharacterized protein involved in exopolysaccharide biosynthesis